MPLIFLIKQVCKNTARAPYSILLYHEPSLFFIILHTSNRKATAHGHAIPRISITVQLGFRRVLYSGSLHTSSLETSPSCGEGQEGVIANKICSTSVSLSPPSTTEKKTEVKALPLSKFEGISGRHSFRSCSGRNGAGSVF